MARYVAKNIVAAGLATRAEVQVAYAIGYHLPVSVNVDTFGTGKADDEKIAAAVQKVVDLRPRLHRRAACAACDQPRRATENHGLGKKSARMWNVY
jgi:S-adenosylmethionine synthetase